MGSGGAFTVTPCGAVGSQATGAWAATCGAAPGATLISAPAYRAFPVTWSEAIMTELMSVTCSPASLRIPTTRMGTPSTQIAGEAARGPSWICVATWVPTITSPGPSVVTEGPELSRVRMLAGTRPPTSPTTS